mmetsp:Transcript_28588/g.38115  ORF Transcript_28588/g.38115 Transcript_28588/m.38115 type:complete len:100 (-) Transcript_28588:861-1160(-)
MVHEHQQASGSKEKVQYVNPELEIENLNANSDLQVRLVTNFRELVDNDEVEDTTSWSLPIGEARAYIGRVARTQVSQSAIRMPGSADDEDSKNILICDN